MPELTTTNSEEKSTPGNEQKPKNRKLSIVKDNYKINSSFDDDGDNVFTDSSTKGNLTKTEVEESENEKRRLVVMQSNNQIKELQTIIWNKETSRTDFIFYSDRLIRLVIEEGLNQLPFEECTVKTHTGAEYNGCSFFKGICGVSIVRSGEAMEKALRECCRSIRIGKMLMVRDENTGERHIVYARFPPDIDERKVLLMYPLLASGGNITLGVDTLLDYGVQEENIYILTLFATQKGIKHLMDKHPKVLLLTTEVAEDVPTHFGEKYFGTE